MRYNGHLKLEEAGQKIAAEVPGVTLDYGDFGLSLVIRGNGRTACLRADAVESFKLGKVPNFASQVRALLGIKNSRLA